MRSTALSAPAHVAVEKQSITATIDGTQIRNLMREPSERQRTSECQNGEPCYYKGRKRARPRSTSISRFDHFRSGHHFPKAIASVPKNPLGVSRLGNFCVSGCVDFCDSHCACFRCVWRILGGAGALYEHVDQRACESS